MGERLLVERTKRGLTQKDLAKQANQLRLPNEKAVTQGDVSALETRKSARSEHAPVLARALGVSLEYLASGQEAGDAPKVEEIRSTYGALLAERDRLRPELPPKHERLRQDFELLLPLMTPDQVELIRRLLHSLPIPSATGASIERGSG